MTEFKNDCENALLALYMEEKFDQKRTESIVQDYTQARLKDCMLKVDFAKAMRSPNGHIYLKVLRENILDELKLVESAKVDEFEWTKKPEYHAAESQYDAESKYNLHHLNNEDAIGYRNLEERAADPDNN